MHDLEFSPLRKCITRGFEQFSPWPTFLLISALRLTMIHCVACTDIPYLDDVLETRMKERLQAPPRIDLDSEPLDKGLETLGFLFLSTETL